MRIILCALAALALASCQKHKDYADAPVAAMIMPVPAAAAAAAAAPAEAADAAREDSTAPRIAAGPPMLAYTYAYGLTLPHDHVDALRRRHEQACVTAGYRVCQVVSTSINEDTHGAATGDLTIRAAPAWLQHFRDGLAGDAKTAGGKVQNSEVTSEDLSRQIVDTSAQLKAKIVLRDRLQNLLANRPGRLSDLLAVERELARVQGEIDSTQSQLTVMQGRVAMSEVTINYSSNDVLGSGVRSPLSLAFRSFFSDMAGSIAGMVGFIAVALPWAMIGGLLFWLLRKRLRGLRWPFRRKTQPA